MVVADSPHDHRVETAGRLAVRRIPIFPETMTVAEAREGLTPAAHDLVDLVLIVDGAGRFRGAAELKQLFGGDAAARLATICDPDWPSVRPDLDQEHAVAVALRAKVSVLAVVRADGRPLGVLPPHTLMDILGREHREDVDRIAGILKERAGARHALEDPPITRVARRLPWLLVGLALSSVATGVMAGFEAALQSNVMIAFFIPALVYLTDAVGTQTEAIAVRGLSVRDQPIWSLLVSEIATGSMIGAILGIVAFVAVWLTFGHAGVAMGVGISLAAAGALACGIGLLFPWTLARIGVDPAFGAGPVATIVQDVLTIVIYFVVMTKVVGLSG